MARPLPPVSEYETSVLRLFPGYAGSVVWFSEPVAYEQTKLDPDLISDLRTWETSYYAGLDADHTWRSDELATRHLAAGSRLARRVADQVGDAFVVEHDAGVGKCRVRAAGPARNSEAAAAFTRRAERARERWDQLSEVVHEAERTGTPLYWSAEP